MAVKTLKSPRAPKAVYKTYTEAVKHLQIGDIVFFHGKIGWQRKLNRLIGDSYWTHVSIVFDIVKNGDEILSVVLIEANETVRLHRLETFAVQEYEYEIGFKRVPGLTPKEMDRFRGFFLDVIDIEYDYDHVVLLFFQFLLSRFIGVRYTKKLVRHALATNEYICSSFVQRALYLAVEPEKRRQTIFLGEETPFAVAHGLVLPKDIAVSKNTIWLFNPHE